VTPRPPETLAATLTTVQAAPLSQIPPAQAARVRRRIVDNEPLTTRLDVAAFSSAT
jgi:hypothetical protein